MVKRCEERGEGRVGGKEGSAPLLLPPRDACWSATGWLPTGGPLGGRVGRTGSRWLAAVAATDCGRANVWHGSPFVWYGSSLGGWDPAATTSVGEFQPDVATQDRTTRVVHMGLHPSVGVIKPSSFTRFRGRCHTPFSRTPQVGVVTPPSRAPFRQAIGLACRVVLSPVLTPAMSQVARSHPPPGQLRAEDGGGDDSDRKSRHKRGVSHTSDGQRTRKALERMAGNVRHGDLAVTAVHRREKQWREEHAVT